MATYETWLAYRRMKIRFTKNVLFCPIERSEMAVHTAFLQLIRGISMPPCVPPKGEILVDATNLYRFVKNRALDFSYDCRDENNLALAFIHRFCYLE